MKIAIGLYGVTRHFNDTFTQWDLPYWKNHNLDFYCSTWNTSRARDLRPDDVSAVTITNEYILEKLPNANISIFDEYLVGWRTDTFFKWNFHVRNILLEIKKSNIKYDKVILIRFDGILVTESSRKDLDEILSSTDMLGLYDGKISDRIPYSGDFGFIGNFDDLYNLFGHSEFPRATFMEERRKNNDEDNHNLLGRYLKEYVGESNLKTGNITIQK